MCSGDFSNIDYTFGGKFVGGPRSSIDSYTNSVSGNVSNEPRRVNVNMYNHVSQRGICTLPSGTEVSIFISRFPAVAILRVDRPVFILSLSHCACQ